jgi:dsDNA-specific endonuclease/ATPase MutS2
MTPERIAKIKTGIIANIQDLITKASPIFENLHSIEEVEQAQKQLDKAYEGGRAAITNSIYNLTEEQKKELYYTFDINFSAVYDLARHAEFNINQGIQ